MKVIAIDPGYDRVGIAVVEKESNSAKEMWLHSETFQTDKQADILDRLFAVGERLEQLILEHQVHCMAIENLFFANNAKTVMHVSEARGVLLYVAKKHNLDIAEYTPLQIKSAVGGHGRAEKQQVIEMTTKLIKIPAGKRLDDEYDAIACALTFFAHHRF